MVVASLVILSTSSLMADSAASRTGWTVILSEKVNCTREGAHDLRREWNELWIGWIEHCGSVSRVFA